MAERVPHPKIIELLAVTLGDSKATSTWEEALRALAIPLADAYSRAQVDTVLAVLAASTPGVAIAARLARARLDPAADEQPPSSQRGDGERRDGRHVSHLRAGRLYSAPAPPADPARGQGDNERVDLNAFLIPALGDDKARETIQQYSNMLNLPVATLNRAQAIQILDAMSHAAGLLGVVARFSKVRFLLKYPGTSRAS